MHPNRHPSEGVILPFPRPLLLWAGRITETPNLTLTLTLSLALNLILTHNAGQHEIALKLLHIHTRKSNIFGICQWFAWFAVFRQTANSDIYNYIYNCFDYLQHYTRYLTSHSDINIVCCQPKPPCCATNRPNQTNVMSSKHISAVPATIYIVELFWH